MKDQFKSLGLGLGLVVVIAASLYGGFRFAIRNEEVDRKFKEVAINTRESVNDKFGVEIPDYDELKDLGTLTGIDENPEWTYTVPEKSSYDDPRIYYSDSYIFNTDGKVLKDFADEGYSYVNLSSDSAHSEAVVVQTRDEKLYYINADLEKTLISENIREAGMCFDGGYFFYLTEFNTTGHSDLYIYDTSTGESKLIAGDVSSDVVISPNGQTVGFNTMDKDLKREFRIMRTDGTVIDSIKLDQYSWVPEALSDDGSVLYYRAYFPNAFFCHTAKGEKKLADGYVFDSFFDRKCGQVLFEDDDSLWYYNADTDKKKKIFDDTHMLYKVCNVDSVCIELYMDKYILDTDSFADAIVFNASDQTNCYGLAGDEPEAVKLTKGSFSCSVGITDEGLVSYYRNTDAQLEKAVYDGKEITRTVQTDENFKVYYLECSDDMSEVWFVNRNDKSLYYRKGDGEFKKLKTFDSSVYNLQWNTYDGKCYYIYDDVLYRIGSDADSDEKVLENVSGFSYSNEIPRTLKVYTKDSKYMVWAVDGFYEIVF